MHRVLFPGDSRSCQLDGTDTYRWHFHLPRSEHSFQLAILKALTKRKLAPVVTLSHRRLPHAGRSTGHWCELSDFQPLSAGTGGSLMFRVPRSYMGPCSIALSYALFPQPPWQPVSDSWPDFIGSQQFCKTLPGKFTVIFFFHSPW